MVAGVTLVGGRIGRDELGEAKNCGVIFRFAMNLVDSGPRRLLVAGRFGSRKVDLHLEAIEFAAKRDATRSTGRMAMETMLARRDDGRLKLEDGFIAQPGCVCKIACGTANCGNQALVRIQANGNLMGRVGHG